MTLSLSMLRTPPGVAAEVRRIDGDTAALGRGTDNDWVLADPERVLSKRHCALARHGDGWQVMDSSSNGTFLNGRCLDTGVARPLRDGDRLTFGAYEMEVRIADPMTTRPADDEPLPGDGFDRLTGDPFAQHDPAGFNGIGLPHDFNHLGEDGLFGDVPVPIVDQASALQERFIPPRLESQMLPADWDADWPLDGDTPPPAPPSAPAAATLPLPATSPPPPLPPLPAATVASDGDKGLAHAFALIAAGAGIEGQPRGRPADTLDALGRAFRALVVGLRRTMIGRAAIKGEFRIEQTMIQASGNNPLKFSADDDDALSALLGIGRRIDMGAGMAVAEALQDIRLHDLAVSAAMQQAVREMLHQLDPIRLRASLPPEALDRLPGRRDRRAWQAVVSRHAELVRAFADDFDSVFGRTFARAYEQVQAELADQHPLDEGRPT